MCVRACRRYAARWRVGFVVRGEHRGLSFSLLGFLVGAF